MKRAILSVVALFFGPWIAFHDARAASTANRPNILVILTDDQGFGDIGIHGNDKIQTPTLDRFAREGIQLTRFYVSPVCSPTRSAIMTGRFPYRTGVIHTSRGGAKMHGDEVTVAELLRDAGYRTGIFGKWHLGDNFPMRPQDQGFDETLVHTSGGIGQAPDTDNSYLNPRLWKNGKPVQTHGYCTDVFFDAAMEFISANRQRPFFVYLPTNVPHTPLEVADAWAEPFRRLGLDDATARVYAMVKNVDDNVARLLARLEELKLRDNTLVIFLTDNGAQQDRFNAGLRGRKSMVYEGGIHVPCFVQWPAQLKGGRTIDRIAAHIDLLPTLLDAAGAKASAGATLDGVSLLPLLRGSTKPADWPERTLFMQCHRGLTPKLFQNAAAITQRFKLVMYPGTFNREDLEPSPSEPVLELYDLEADRGEQHDLAAQHQDMVDKLCRQYEAWFTDVWRSRRFTPGIIHVGNDAENPVRLCRYQDATWKFDQPHGWVVNIERAGRYEVTLRPEDVPGPGRILVNWQGGEFSQPLSSGEHSAVFDLAAAQGTLDVAFVADATGRTETVGKNIGGDVDIRYVGPSTVPSGNLGKVRKRK